MIVVNFSHPLTATHLEQIETIAQQKVGQTITIACDFDDSQLFSEQVIALIEQVELSAETWQTTPLIINPPSYAPITATLLAALHGRMGHFPAIIRMRPRPDSVLQQYEVAEIINLHTIRKQARDLRKPDV